MAFTIINAATWPTILQRERSTRWSPDFGNESSPPALDGTRQYRNTNGGGLWRASFQNFQLMTREQVLTWEALEVKLRGGMTPVDVPLCNYTARRVNSANPIIFKAINGGWAARAVAGRVSIRKSDGLMDGMHFADYDGTTYGWRLYRIAKVHPFIDTALLGDEEQYDIDFWPPARKAVANNHDLEIEEPKCVMRLTASDSMDVALELRRRGNPNAEFVEAF